MFQSLFNEIVTTNLGEISTLTRPRDAWFSTLPYTFVNNFHFDYTPTLRLPFKFRFLKRKKENNGFGFISEFRLVLLKVKNLPLDRQDSSNAIRYLSKRILWAYAVNFISNFQLQQHIFRGRLLQNGLRWGS